MRRWAGKDKLEALRKTEKVSGNEWWLLQDFWTGANGILDTYYVSKHPPSELVRLPSPLLLRIYGRSSSMLRVSSRAFAGQACFVQTNSHWVSAIRTRSAR